MGLAAVAALAVAGCGGEDTKTVTVSSSGSTQTPPSDSGSDDESESGSVDAGSALAKKTFRGVGSKDGTVDVSIVSLKVEDRLMRLTIAFSPKYPSESPDEAISMYDMNGDSPLYVSLVDSINLKRYVVVKDSSDTELQPDEVSSDTPTGGTVTGTWTFAAAPAGVEKIDVQIGEIGSFSDIPIQR